MLIFPTQLPRQAGRTQWTWPLPHSQIARCTMTINIWDNTILDDITKWSSGCAGKSKAVIGQPERVMELDHVFLSIQQHNCGESEGLINKHLELSQWISCLQHVMSEVHRLLHSGCLWVCLKSPFSLIQTNTGWLIGSVSLCGSCKSPW